MQNLESMVAISLFGRCACECQTLSWSGESIAFNHSPPPELVEQKHQVAETR